MACKLSPLGIPFRAHDGLDSYISFQAFIQVNTRDLVHAVFVVVLGVYYTPSRIPPERPHILQVRSTVSLASVKRSSSNSIFSLRKDWHAL